MQAKTRVAPAPNESNMQVSIPRLELLAATIGARLTSSILEALSLKNLTIYYWSDSSTVISWIHRENNWSVFVENRVKEIKKLTDFEQWRHIPEHLNPADFRPEATQPNSFCPRNGERDLYGYGMNLNSGLVKSLYLMSLKLMPN